MTSAPGHEERVIFAAAAEAFYLRALKGRVTPELKDALKKLGIDLDRPLHPAYPWTTWVKSLEISAATLHPHLPRAEAFYELGQKLIASYQETLVGKALFGALKLFPPRRVIDRMSRSFRTSNNFTEVVVEDVAPNVVNLRFNVVESDPSFTQGILARGLPSIGIATAKVTLHRLDGEGAIYRVTW